MKKIEIFDTTLRDGEQATKGFKYKMKIVFVHFPMTVNIKDHEFIISNFIGERKSREAKILGDVKVSVQSDDVIIEGKSIEEVAQTAANIQQATKIRKKDLRKFIDGIYLYSKEWKLSEKYEWNLYKK